MESKTAHVGSLLEKMARRISRYATGKEEVAARKGEPESRTVGVNQEREFPASEMVDGSDLPADYE